jgi:hypothetical protein
VAARSFHLSPSEEQLRDLPETGFVPDAKLAELLDGKFSGYLHHEELDRYQAVTLNVVASVSTENPHNPNKIFVSGTAVLHFGEPALGQLVAQRYEPRSFYLRPGFALNAPGTDSFLMIEEWKQGYIRGIWYSQAFGRVGTVELVKGELPRLSAGAKKIPAWQGEFSRNFSADGKSKRWFSVLSASQPAERLSSTVSFMGSYQALVSLTPIEPMERGAFDPYTGALGWSFSPKERGGLSVASGKLGDDGSLEMHWPPAPNVFPTAMADFELDKYPKTKERKK